MKTLAIGRICQDEFYLVRTAKNRIASTKLTADYIGRQFGGSVFSEAKMLAEAGVDCTFLAGVSLGEDAFLKMPLSLKIVKTPATSRSFIYLKEGYKLDRIYSLEETEGEKIEPIPSLIEEIASEIAPSRLLYDLRQIPLTKALQKRLSGKNVQTFLDPGSTVFYTEDSEKKQEMASVIGQSDIICAGLDFFEHYGRFTRLSDYFSLPLFENAKLLIATLSDGRNVFAAREFRFTVHRLNQLSIGNTMGAGDAFRGAFLATWQQTWDVVTYDGVLEGAKMAVAAATLKIEDKDPLPKMPRMEDVKALAERLAIRVKQDDSLL